MRTYTMRTTNWGDGWITTDLFNARGNWADNITVPASTFQQDAGGKLQTRGYENIQWLNNEPISATQDEHREMRVFLDALDDSDESLPPVDENTDWEVDRIDDYEMPEVSEEMVQASDARVAFESLVNEALGDDIQVSFLRWPDGFVAGWGAVPVQIHGLIGPDAHTAGVSTARARIFYFRLRSNTARLEVYPDRNVPRDRLDRLGDTIETSSIYPVIEGDDYLGDLPADANEAADLFTTLVKNLAAPDAITNPTYGQHMNSWLVPAAIARELSAGGIDAANAVARTYLDNESAAVYAQKWLDMSQIQKEQALADCS